MDLNLFFEKAWLEFLRTTPSAKAIKELLENRGENPVNDHVAYRTFRYPGMEKEKLAEYFISKGYEPKGEYDFEEKKLKAFYLEHPKNHPKIFISELLLNEFDESFQKTIKDILKTREVPRNSLALLGFGSPWKVSKVIYDEVSKVSEYAGWLLALGFRPNHFTVSVNEMETFRDIRDLNQLLKDSGYKLNSHGGEVKGGPEVLLEQSSIMADNQKVKFSDGEYLIATCYYEFAKRYEDENGKLYQGFVAKSADKIFESTHR